METECPESLDGRHLWVRRRDGKACADCGIRHFGSSDLTDEERTRIEQRKAEPPDYAIYGE